MDDFDDTPVFWERVAYLETQTKVIALTASSTCASLIVEKLVPYPDLPL